MPKTYQNIKVVGFDADDTLWVNETYFREAEAAFSKRLSNYETPNRIDQELFRIELKNLDRYGYGVKAFMLSMIETALELSHNNVTAPTIAEILNIGKTMLDKPVTLLDDVETVLKTLYKKYKLILVTKGDLRDQERKLEKSGLTSYFHHIEILSDKKITNYSSLLNRLEIKPAEFLMVGNSLKSDILPLLTLKAHAIHIPFHTTWVHETVSETERLGKNYKTLPCLTELLPLLV